MICITRSLTKELFTPFENPKREFRSSRKLFKTPSLDESSSLEFDLFSDIEEHFEEEVKGTMTETMEEYMKIFKTPSLDESSSLEFDLFSNIEEHFEEEVAGTITETIKEYMCKTRERCDNTINGSGHEDLNEHIEKVLEIVDLFHIPNITQDHIMLQAFPMSLTGAASRCLRNKPSSSITTWEDQKAKFLSKLKELLMKCPQHYITDMQEVILFYNGLEVPTRQILDFKGVVPTKIVANAKIAIQEMVEYSQKWHNGTSKTKMGCEQRKGPHYTKDCPLKEEGKTLEEAYYTQFGVPFQQGGQYRAATPRFYQRNNANPSYQERRQSMEESLNKFMNESAKRHEENSNMIKEIQASTDAAIRNQGALIKTLEIQIRKMSKSISTTVETDTTPIHHRGSSQYTVSAQQNSKLIFESRQAIIPFPSRLNECCCDEKKGLYGLQYLDTYSYGATRLNDSLPRKEKDPGSFTLPSYINNIYFKNALADLGACVSIMPLSTYLNLGLGDLAHTKLTVELVDRTVKHPKGIAENILVGIGKFVFPIDFIILDMPEDVNVPLILGRPFLSTAHAKIDMFKRKITLRVRDEKYIFKSVKPTSSLIKRVYMLILRERTELNLEARLMGETLILNRSLDPLYEDYIELHDLNEPLELRRNQVDDLKPTIEEGEIVEIVDKP
ncbi:ribonuclease H-like domain, reverse transcriptase, RNA-dependent DNA polymerase [Tanacetum coccineum]